MIYNYLEVLSDLSDCSFVAYCFNSLIQNATRLRKNDTQKRKVKNSLQLHVNFVKLPG
jgi:hypothetical protein